MAFEPAGASRPSPASLFARKPELRLMLLAGAWPHAVGEDLARRCPLLAIQGNVLRVGVPDAAWRKALMKMAGTILGRLHGAAGPLAPRRLAFVEHADPTATLEPPVAPPPAPPPLPASIVEAAGIIPDPELRERFLLAAAVHLNLKSRRSRTDA